MSSGAKQIFSSTLPHSDNCAWEGFFTCSLRVVSVWAHSMQLISFTTKSLQIFYWNGNIILAVTCTPESLSHVDNQAELPMTSATDSLSPITCTYINTCMSHLWWRDYLQKNYLAYNYQFCVYDSEFSPYSLVRNFEKLILFGETPTVNIDQGDYKLNFKDGASCCQNTTKCGWYG